MPQPLREDFACSGDDTPSPSMIQRKASVSAASLDLDRNVTKSAQTAKPALVCGRRQGMVRDHGYHRRPMSGADLPKMKIGDAVAFRLHPLTNDAFEIFVRVDV